MENGIEESKVPVHSLSYLFRLVHSVVYSVVFYMNLSFSSVASKTNTNWILFLQQQRSGVASTSSRESNIGPAESGVGNLLKFFGV
jgi:hypothetical protein